MRRVGGRALGTAAVWLVVFAAAGCGRRGSESGRTRGTGTAPAAVIPSEPPDPADPAVAGIFFVLLGTPWTQMLSRVLDAIAPSPTGSLMTGLVLGVIGVVANVAILYFAARWIVERVPSR